MTLTEFLLARIYDDETVAKACSEPSVDAMEGWPACNAAHVLRHDPWRVLGECAAKRRIVDRISVNPDGFPWHQAVLAEVYADHPDYDEEWRP